MQSHLTTRSLILLPGREEFAASPEAAACGAVVGVDGLLLFDFSSGIWNNCCTVCTESNIGFFSSSVVDPIRDPLLVSTLVAREMFVCRLGYEDLFLTGFESFGVSFSTVNSTSELGLLPN